MSVSEQEDDPAQPTLFELLYQQMDKEPQKAESGGSSKSLDQDEKFSSNQLMESVDILHRVFGY